MELNILDGTCNAIDIAYFFRNNPMSTAEAEARGLMPKTMVGEQTAASRIGFVIANRASEDLYTALINGQCTAEEAYTCCIIATTEKGQKLALDQRQQAKKASWEYITAYVRQAEGMTSTNTQLDLFGNDTSWKEEAEKVAKYTAKARAQIKDRLNLLRSSQRVEKRQDIAKELGVEIKTPEEASQLIGKLMRLDAAYEHLDPALGINSKAQAWNGKSAVEVDLSVLEVGASFSIDANEWKREKIKEIAKTKEGQEFIKFVYHTLEHKGSKKVKKHTFRKLTPEEASDLGSLLNIDLTNGVFELPFDSIVHFDKHKNDSKIEKDQRDITLNDILMIPYILEKKDMVETQGSGKIFFYKNMPDGRVQLVFLSLGKSSKNEPRLLLKTGWAKSDLGLSPKVNAQTNEDGLIPPDDLNITKTRKGVKKIYPQNFETSFSLATFADIASNQAQSNEYEQQLIRHADAELRRWSRLFSGKTNSHQAAQELGRAQALMNAIYAKLEPKYRPKLKAQMKLIEVYARAIERGRISSLGQLSAADKTSLEQDIQAEFELLEQEEFEEILKDVYAEVAHTFDTPRSAQETRAMRQQAVRTIAQNKASFLVEQMLKDARAHLDLQLADRERQRIEQLYSRLAPKKLKNGKTGKGKVNAPAQV